MIFYEKAKILDKFKRIESLWYHEFSKKSYGEMLNWIWENLKSAFRIEIKSSFFKSLVAARGDKIRVPISDIQCSKLKFLNNFVTLQFKGPITTRLTISCCDDGQIARVIMVSNIEQLTNSFFNGIWLVFDGVLWYLIASFYKIVRSEIIQQFFLI